MDNAHNRRKRPIEKKAQLNLLRLKITLKKGLCRSCFFLTPPCHPRFVSSGWSRHLVGSCIWSVQSVKVSNTTQHPPPGHSYLGVGGGGSAGTMPLNTSWSKFQETLTNALASYVLYAVCFLLNLFSVRRQRPGQDPRGHHPSQQLPPPRRQAGSRTPCQAGAA
jgi:hypothetical protein